MRKIKSNTARLQLGKQKIAPLIRPVANRLKGGQTTLVDSMDCGQLTPPTTVSTVATTVITKP